jgi:hypothetical protein
MSPPWEVEGSKQGKKIKGNRYPNWLEWVGFQGEAGHNSL